ncbi:MAG: hypothetical protein GWN36_15125 [Gemmatimonadetes bacterium]|nr:hypothetical protein [Gemmatimonadota bacterium]
MASRRDRSSGTETFEARILDLLLSGDDPVLEILRDQRRTVRVRARDRTEIGCLVSLETEPDAPLTEPPSFALRDVWFQLRGCAEEGAAILFVRKGRLDTLELYNWTDPWPDSPSLAGSGYLVARPRGPEGEPVAYELERIEERDPAYLEEQIRGSDRPEEA